MKKSISRETLQGYLDDALDDEEAAQVEAALRASDELRQLLKAVMDERDRGEHSLGAVWRRHRLSCPTREILGSYLLQVLDEAQQDYINFHLRTVACPYCLANLEDLKSLQQEPAPKKQARHRRFFESSAGYLKVGRQS
jgi:DNA-binding phage protein